ncbi:hypothetical protein NQ317_003279 [Molorchus minor]|uniref:Uncharacterized protein n=1 Tax=Molorchus minor TaxID=1323400 RepID=A0ABQ9JLJ1_9CUCU|nr:hypothetical protein NQ317_003279 [Molorchus minor]
MSKFCGVPISLGVLDVVSRNRKNKIAVREFGIHHATTLIKNILSSQDQVFGGLQGSVEKAWICLYGYRTSIIKKAKITFMF